MYGFVMWNGYHIQGDYFYSMFDECVWSASWLWKLQWAQQAAVQWKNTIFCSLSKIFGEKSIIYHDKKATPYTTQGNAAEFKLVILIENYNRNRTMSLHIRITSSGKGSGDGTGLLNKQKPPNASNDNNKNKNE